MAKLNWDRVTKENLTLRNGAENIETTEVGRKGIPALQRWKDITEQLRLRSPRISRLKLLKGNGKAVYLAYDNERVGSRSKATSTLISIRDLAKELGIAPRALIHRARLRGIKVSNQQAVISMQIAEKLSGFFGK